VPLEDHEAALVLVQVKLRDRHGLGSIAAGSSTEFAARLRMMMMTR